MAYSTAANIKVVLLNVATYTFDDTAIGSFIAKADALIDSYLANVYTVPFTTTPAIINSLSVDIACYYLLRTTYTNDRVEEKNSWVIEWYNKALEILKKLANKEMSLGTAYVPTSSIVSSTDENYTSTFDIDNVEDWKRSEQRLEDIANDRDGD
jgi:phage gp36-like protein